MSSPAAGRSAQGAAPEAAQEPRRSPASRRRTWLVAAGAVLGAVAVFLRPPGSSLDDQTFGSVSITTTIVAAAFVVAGRWLVARVRARVWRPAALLGLLFALLAIVGDLLGGQEPQPLSDLTRLQAAALPVRLLGLAWVFALVLAGVFEAALRQRDASVSDGTGRSGAFLAALRSGTSSRPVWALFALLVLVRVPALAVWFPGVVPFDTYRSYVQVRGVGEWSSYEPVGHTALVWVYQQVGGLLSLGDTGKVALAVVVQILAMAGACTFALVRMARWGVHRFVLWGALAWFALSPVFGLFSVIQVKDVPFALAALVFCVAVAEVTVHDAQVRQAYDTDEPARERAAGGPARRGRFARAAQLGPGRRWPWVVMALAGLATIVLRNNGIHVVVLTLVVLLVALRGLRRPLLAVLVACLAGYAVYTGPVFSALGIGESREVEMFSGPIQQVSRIALAHGDELSATDRQWIADNFDGMTPAELGDAYDDGVSDPPKEAALRSWDDHTTGEFLGGWARLVRQYPDTAVEATLAATVGYWYPDAPLRDVFYTWSRNDVRGLHLDIPYGPPEPGLRKELVDASLLSTDPDDTRNGMTTNPGFMGPAFRTIPVVGQVVSPGLVAWGWLTCAVGVWLLGRRRRWAVMVPAGVLFLTLLASPVSGSVRYALLLFAALPLAVAMIATPVRPATSPVRPATPVRPASSPDPG